MDFEPIVGFVILLVFTIAIIPLITSLTQINHQTQCSTEIGKINDLGNQLQAVNAEKKGITDQLNDCQKTYTDLLKNNITKQDFIDIKDKLNQTNVYVSNVYSRLDNIENKINSFNTLTVNIFNLSFALNIVLAIELLSFAFLKNEFLQWVWELHIKIPRLKAWVF